jgi:hypothetical protein
LSDKRAEEFFFIGLRSYVSWLNTVQHANGITDSDYTVESFTVNDKKRNLFGWYKILSFTSPADNCDGILHAVINDGDEGGSTDLIMGFNLYEYGVIEIQFILQGFDTSWQMIYNEGKFREL